MGLKQLYWGISNFVFWNILVKLKWILFRLFKSKNEKNVFSIGIVTYIARYENYFSSLINELTKLFPSTEIIVVANGYYDKNKQLSYLRDIESSLSRFSNVRLVKKVEPMGLSSLWNEIILTANSANVFLLNDDIKVAPGIENELRSIRTDGVCLINNSWSHFFINKKITETIGFFDEGFKGIGNEDQDYEFRMLMKGRTIKNVYLKNIKSLNDMPSDYSYGKNIEIANNKYSKVNYDYFLSKWQIHESEQHGYTYSPKFKLWFKPNNANS